MKMIVCCYGNMMKDDGCCKNTHKNMFIENNGFVCRKMDMLRY